jgi:hypothetical protein
MKLEDAPDPVELLHDGFGSVAVCPPWNDTVKEVASLARWPVLATDVETSARATGDECLALLRRNEVEREARTGRRSVRQRMEKATVSAARLVTRRVFATDIFERLRGKGRHKVEEVRVDPSC